MAKREYIQANKDWLEAKAREEGVKALPKGIYASISGSCTFLSIPLSEDNTIVTIGSSPGINPSQPLSGSIRSVIL